MDNTENYKKLIKLMIDNKDDVIASISRRQNTSTHNKELHGSMLNALLNEDELSMLKMITNPSYIRPLDGVLWCVNCDNDVKIEMIELFGYGE